MVVMRLQDFTCIKPDVKKRPLQGNHCGKHTILYVIRLLVVLISICHDFSERSNV